MLNRTRGIVGLLSTDKAPILEVKNKQGTVIDWPFNLQPNDGENIWQTWPNIPKAGEWQFRIRLRNGRYLHPQHNSHFSTSHHTIWVNQNQLFAYQPAAEISPSRVEKIEQFEGRLSTRPLYIYLPRGYDNHPDKIYPVLYMHDGQNVFESFVQDSYVGSWRADEVADCLIEKALIPEIMIVGVSHGNKDRIKEYLPPFSHYPLKPEGGDGEGVTRGAADQTADYYMQDVAKYIQENYRASADPALTATCGSSMGGLMSLYMGWNCPEFAHSHAVLSPSIWATLNDQRQYEMIECFGTADQFPNLRLWIDSGQFAAERQGNDGQAEVKIARDKLLANGFKPEQHFAYCFYEGATHSEAAWSGRLDQVFRFLFPFR